jgi:hypothetical protein
MIIWVKKAFSINRFMLKGSSEAFQVIYKARARIAKK